jgi:hypothetical protein
MDRSIHMLLASAGVTRIRTRSLAALGSTGSLESLLTLFVLLFLVEALDVKFASISALRKGALDLLRRRTHPLMLGRILRINLEARHANLSLLEALIDVVKDNVEDIHFLSGRTVVPVVDQPVEAMQRLIETDERDGIVTGQVVKLWCVRIQDGHMWNEVRLKVARRDVTHCR